MKKYAILTVLCFLFFSWLTTAVFAEEKIDVPVIVQKSSGEAAFPVKVETSIESSLIDGKVLLSGAIGALIAALITSLSTIYSVKKNCDNSIKILERDLQARVDEQDRNFKLQLVKIGFEEKKKTCLTYLNYLHPDKIISGNYQMEEIERMLTMAQLFVDNELYNQLVEIKDLLEEREYFSYVHSHPGDENLTGERLNELCEPRFKKEYRDAYGFLVFHTRAALNLESLNEALIDRE